MRLKPVYWLVLLSLVLLVCPAGGAAQEKAPTPEAKSSTAPAPKPEAVQAPASPAPTATAEKPDPKQVLRQMCDYLKSLKEFSFKGEITDDQTFEAGNKLQFAFGVEGYVKRPDKIRINAKGDLQNKEVLYDGQTFTIFDTVKKFYVSAAMPPTIDEALAKVNNDYGIRLIVADLAKTNLFDSITAGAEDQLYVGEGVVFGVKCHHIAFDKEKIEVQLWVDASDKPVLRKAVVTFKEVDLSPQWTLYLTEWNVSPQLADGMFAFSPPQGAIKADFVGEIEKAAAAKKEKEKPKKKKKKGGQS